MTHVYPWLPLVLCGLLLAYLIWTFNRLVSLSNRADGAWSDIDVQLKRRWDLVPALVATVEGYAKHETGTLEKVVAARQQATAAGSIAARGEPEKQLSAAVQGIFALAEAYPNLKANQNFLDLQKSLVDIEDHVQYARRYYNAVVRDLNTLIASFPSNLIANTMRFRKREFFQIEEQERAAPRVQMNGQGEGS